MLTDQNLSMAKGDTYVFEIDMQANGTPVDLTGATAQWVLSESWFDGAQIFLTKTVGSGLTIIQELGVWKIVVAIAPSDTATDAIPSGTLYHDCKVTLADSTVAHVASGEFILDPSVNP